MNKLTFPTSLADVQKILDEHKFHGLVTEINYTDFGRDDLKINIEVALLESSVETEPTESDYDHAMKLLGDLRG